MRKSCSETRYPPLCSKFSGTTLEYYLYIPIQEVTMKKRTATEVINSTPTVGGKPSRTRKPRQADAELIECNIMEELAPLPLGSPALADLLPSLVAFFGAQNMCAQIVDPDSGEKHGTFGKLPHIIAVALPTDLMSCVARASLSDSVWYLPARTIGCVAMPAITEENLDVALVIGGLARFRAHEGYVAAAHISADPAFRRELAELATFFKIGVIEVGHGAEKTRIIHPAQGLAVDSSFGITFPRLSA
jgi:hypothetical protein